MKVTKYFTVETTNPYDYQHFSHEYEGKDAFDDSVMKMMAGGYCITQVELIARTFDTETFKMESKVIKTATRQYTRGLGWYPVITEN